MTDLRIALYYEHPEWYKPLIAELERRGVDVVLHHAATHSFDPTVTELDVDLVVNRMSPSSWTRGHGNAIFYTHAYLDYLDQIGAPVVNNAASWRLETSKAMQITLMEQLGVRYPRARVINSAQQAVTASDGLQFPVVTKANIGGSGAGITLFETRDELAAAADAGLIDFGLDNTALVQEFLTPADGYIVRVEFLNNDYLYAIKVESNPAAGFNLCPADVCEVPGDSTDGTPAVEETNGFDADFCPVETPAKRDVQGYTPPREIIDTVLQLGRAGQLDIGGIEYLVSDRDGQAYFYDINALSNFVANAPQVIGFDPFVNFADYLVARAMQDQRQRNAVPA